MKRVTAGLVLFVSLFSCSSPPCDPGPCTSTGGGTATAGGSGTAGGTAGGSAGGTAGGATWAPFPSKAACATPTVQQGAMLGDGGAQQFVRPQLVSAGTEAGLIYQQNAGGVRQVWFQRLTTAGQLSGARSLIGVDAGTLGSPTSGASDGTRYLLCVEGGGCSTAPVGSGDPVATAYAPGTAGGVSLAYGPGGFVIAQGNSVQALTSAGAASGSAKTFGSAAGSNESRIVPRTSGYAVAIGSTLYPLDPQLTQVGSTVSVFSGQMELASSGDKVGVISAQSSKVVVAIADTVSGNITTAAQVEPTGSTYGQVSIAGGTDSFAAAWSSFSGYIGYRAVSSAGAPQGDGGITAISVGWDDNMNAVAAVSDGFLVVSNVSPGANALQVVHLSCP